MNIHSSLTTELRDKAYRDAYVASQIRIGLPFQIRALRKAKELTQEQLATKAQMAQPRIPEIERGKRSLNIDTLLRIASALDVALEVRFVPFGELIRWSESLDPDTFDVDSFDEELEASEKAATVSAEIDRLFGDLKRKSERAALTLVSSQAFSPAAATQPTFQFSPDLRLVADNATIAANQFNDSLTTQTLEASAVQSFKSAIGGW